MRTNPVYGFLARVLLWLTLSFAIWFPIADMLMRPAGWIAYGVLGSAVPELRLFPEYEPGVLRFTSTPLPGMTVGGFTQTVSITFEVNALSYGYGTPVLAALVLAARGKRWLRKLALGMALLVPYQAWGLVFDALQHLSVSAGPYLPGSNAWWNTTPGRELVRLAFQLGYLILPPLAPMLLWGAMSRGFIAGIMLEGGIRQAPRLRNGPSRKGAALTDPMHTLKESAARRPQYFADAGVVCTRNGVPVLKPQYGKPVERDAQRALDRSAPSVGMIDPAPGRDGASPC